jgi:Fanconi-associated nuclease 1
MDIPGVFISPHQSAPMDFGSFFFYTQRQGVIHERLECIRNRDFGYIIETHYDLYFPERILCVGLHWELVSKEDLLHISKLLGGRALANICEWIAKGHSMSGFPDLCLWKENDIWFVEVKVKHSLSHNVRVRID